jgi:hypothetical protein
VENVGGGVASMGAGTEGEHSTTSTNLSDDDFVQTTLEGMGGGPTAEPSAMAPMPGVLGDESSDLDGKDVGGGNASPSEDREADSADLRCPVVAPTMEVSEDEVEAHSPAAPFESVAF